MAEANAMQERGLVSLMSHDAEINSGPVKFKPLAASGHAFVS